MKHCAVISFNSEFIPSLKWPKQNQAWANANRERFSSTDIGRVSAMQMALTSVLKEARGHALLFLVCATCSAGRKHHYAR